MRLCVFVIYFESSNIILVFVKWEKSLACGLLNTAFPFIERIASIKPSLTLTIKSWKLTSYVADAVAPSVAEDVSDFILRLLNSTLLPFSRHKTFWKGVRIHVVNWSILIRLNVLLVAWWSDCHWQCLSYRTRWHIRSFNDTVNLDSRWLHCRLRHSGPNGRNWPIFLLIILSHLHNSLWGGVWTRGRGGVRVCTNC